MERYFIIDKDHHIYKEYFEWKDCANKLAKKFNEFKNKTGIETNLFVPQKELLIVPTENDLNQYQDQYYKKDYGHSLKGFKKKSYLYKLWEDLTKDIIFKYKPTLFYDFPIFGKTRTRIFDYQDKVYCSLESDYLNENTQIPKGYTEIKASKFYKIIETIEEEENKNETNQS